MGIKDIVRENCLYKNFIRPIRAKWKERALAKLSDEEYFIKRHKKVFGYVPDFKNPQTYNEKIIHRILFDRRPINTALAYKHQARMYIATLLKECDNANSCWGGGEQPYSLKQIDSNILGIYKETNPQDSLQSNPTHRTTQIRNRTYLDSILSPQSPLFQSIDLLTDTLFATNTCPYLPKLYGIYKSIDEIDFSQLPQSFVLKTNHDCGGVVIVPDKDVFLADSKILTQSTQKLTEHLKINYYTMYREWHYKDIEPRIFAEELLGEDLHDFRFHCFGGVPQFIQVANTTHTRNTLFDTQWNVLDITYLNPPSEIPPAKPESLRDMCAIAKCLSTPFKYVRVDLYCIQNRIFAGELTFTPNGGAARFEPYRYDRIFGEMWQ